MTVTDSSPATTPASDGSFSTLWTDGAARGNPGPAGIGVMLKAANGEVIVAEGQFVGLSVINHLEVLSP